ncbi:hypothetical protein [Empedobacter tilapiae]|uniref:hypothetical protein n=1 Tax=Empedobacter tilapiae TaxID=2491114 RepID=UPI0028D57CDE|nr:hypothetical protein [Empedobacter tilapiae]
MKKNSILLKFTIAIAILTFIYSVSYIFGYYFRNDILFFTPDGYKIIDNNKIKLDPNEIGDSIGGVLNPIIGILGAILTFLAFYIQYQANNFQRKAFNKTLKKESKSLFKKHKSNLKLYVKILENINKDLLSEYNSFMEYIESEISNPLKLNYHNTLSTTNYINYNELGFKDIYESLEYYFNKSRTEWEDHYISASNIINFYINLNKEFESYILKGIEAKVKLYDNTINNSEDLINNLLFLNDNRIDNNKHVENYKKHFIELEDSEDLQINLNNVQSCFFNDLIKDLSTVFYLEDTEKEDKTKIGKLLIQASKANKEIGNFKYKAEISLKQKQKILQDSYNLKDSNLYFHHILNFSNIVKKSFGKT